MNTGKLLEKYYDGLASEAEEHLIRELLLSDDLPEEFEDDREIILSLLEMTSVHIPEPGFEKEIIASLNRKEKLIRGSRTRHVYYAITGIAATLLLAVSLWFIAGRNSEPPDTFNSPELAYAETKLILHRISSEMNKGKSSLASLEYLNRAEEGVKSVESTGRLLRKGLGSVEKLYGKLAIDIE